MTVLDVTHSPQIQVQIYPAQNKICMLILHTSKVSFWVILGNLPWY